MNRATALTLAALLTLTPGCFSWQITETVVPGSEREGPVTTLHELRARPWNRLQKGALPIRLELYGTRHDERARTITQQVELDIWSVTGAFVSNATAAGTFDGYLAVLVCTPFTLVTDLFLLMFSPPTLPFTKPEAPPAGPQAQVQRGEEEQVLEPLPLGTRLTLDWGEGIAPQQVVLAQDGMHYLKFASQARQALALGQSQVRLGIAPEQPAGMRALVTLPLLLLIESAALEIEGQDPQVNQRGWEELLQACPPQAEEVRAALEERARLASEQ